MSLSDSAATSLVGLLAHEEIITNKPKQRVDYRSKFFCRRAGVNSALGCLYKSGLGCFGLVLVTLNTNIRRTP